MPTSQNTSKKKIPERKCVGCNETKPKNQLLRVVRTPDGSVILDFTGKKSGRGAYICNDVQCFKKARKSKKLEKNLECEIPGEIFDMLEAKLEKDGG